MEDKPNKRDKPDKPDNTCSEFANNNLPIKLMGKMPSYHIKTPYYIKKLKEAQNSILNSN